jgi:tRNA G18 (ribose-2'-O)-methylase SpoU
MGDVPPSTDPVADPLDDYRALNDPEQRRLVERRGGYFVVEGVLALGALLASPYPVRSVLASERRAARVRALVAGRAPVVVRSDDEVAAVAGFDVHRGVLAAADRLPLPDAADVVQGARLVAVVEGVGDHENLGALFRNAAAFGLDAVLLDPTTADPLYRRSVRVSLGHVLRVPWSRLAAWPDGLGALREQGFELLALTPADEAESIDAVAAGVARSRGTGEQPRLAVIVGAEGSGLTSDALAAADRRVRIPLAPGVDSLNVATAAAIAFHRLTPAPDGSARRRSTGSAGTNEA